jgi:PAS domain S-box-containing protein
MNKKVLLVDDDQLILDGYRRVLRSDFDLVTCSSGAQGVVAITEQGPFAVVVSDYRMPEINGIQFLTKVRQIAPDTVRVMLTGQADMQVAIDAINNGALYRFLTKPCSTEVLSQTLYDGVEQFQLTAAERNRWDQTIRTLTSILSNAPVAIVIYRNGLLVFVNQTFINMFDFQPDYGLSAESAAEFIAPEYRREVLKRLDNLGHDMAIAKLLESTGVKKDGSTFPIYIELTKIDVPSGSASVAYISDISDRKMAEEKLLESSSKVIETVTAQPVEK